MVQREAQIRMAAFRWLEEQTAHSDVLTWHTLAQGFTYQGERVTLVGQQGIWKPRAFAQIPISIRSTPHSGYGDLVTDDGFLLYSYRRTDPFHRDNTGLREAMRQNVPLIYFHGIGDGKYVPTWPVFVVDDRPSDLSFVVAVDAVEAINPLSGEAVGEGDYYRRRYVTAAARVRLHQAAFREKVINAYRSQCAFCRLRHLELLDAAHIIPDREAAGEPIVPNGLALCKIHHAAYDQNIIGVTPDYEILVRDDVLAEEDGPMLQYGIQALHKRSLILPERRKDWPDRDRLAVRFEIFTNAI